ncbi:MAG: hypothetical protein OEY77_00050 [Nitrospira sp.]|nr:hypothetical protein [Nitrospira sp.]
MSKTTKQPDRWERMVEGDIESDNGWIRDVDAVKLLRREHRAAVRIVKNEPELPGVMPLEMWDAIKSSREVASEALRIAVQKTKRNILDQLKRRSQ